jgi:hypothetical protein
MLHLREIKERIAGRGSDIDEAKRKRIRNVIMFVGIIY